MPIKNLIHKAFVLVVASSCFILIESGNVKAQEDQPSTMQKTQPVIKQDSWESWKQDIKSRYQQIREQADKIKADAANKKITDPALKEAIDNFEANAKTFSDRWSSADQVPPDKREQFKSDVGIALDKMKTAFDNLRSEWDSVNK